LHPNRPLNHRFRPHPHPHRHSTPAPKRPEQLQELLDNLFDGNKNHPVPTNLPEIEGEYAYRDGKRSPVNIEDHTPTLQDIIERLTGGESEKSVGRKLLTNQELTEDEQRQLNNGKLPNKRRVSNDSPIVEEVIQAVLKDHPNLINVKALSFESFGVHYIYTGYYVHAVLGVCDKKEPCRPELVDRVNVYELKAHKTFLFPIHSDGLKNIDTHPSPTPNSVRIPLVVHPGRRHGFLLPPRPHSLRSHRRYPYGPRSSL